MAGLDPAMHHNDQRFLPDGCAGLRRAEGGFGPAGGSSPRMTSCELVVYCDSFTKSGNFNLPSAILGGHTVTCLPFCHWNTRPVT